MPQESRISVDSEKIKTAIHAGIPLTVTTYTMPHEMECYMQDVLAEFLNQLNQSQYVDYLTYSLDELINNAKKANMKRAFFKQHNLNIESTRDYELGMQKFKKETMKNLKYYLHMLKEKGLYVKLILQTRKNKIKIEVRNNSILAYPEYKRIHDKLNRAQQYTSVDEVINVLDETEGAGLGLIIMILMLKKIGLTEENYQVVCENGETITRLILPFNEKKKREISLFSEEFMKMIITLPVMPDNILKIIKLLNDPDVRPAEISLQIAQDAELLSKLLKMINATSVDYKKCRSFEEAVNLLGIRSVRNMLYSIGAIEVLKTIDSFRHEEELWEHSNRVAFYAYNLARNFCKPNEKAILDDSYLSGLMHDVGKVIFITEKNDLLDKMQKQFESKGYSADAYEKLTAGVNHGEIGALITDRWNFPETITNAIRSHHYPEDIHEDQRKLAAIVNLADMMAHYNNHSVDFYQFDPSILEMFNITSEVQIKNMTEKMENVFKEKILNN